MRNQEKNYEQHAPIQRAAAAADCLIRRGIPGTFRNDLVAVIFQALREIETEARQSEREEATAEWLIKTLPPDVIQLAAEKVAARTY